MGQVVQFERPPASPPAGLTPDEVDEWRAQQRRVFNTLMYRARAAHATLLVERADWPGATSPGAQDWIDRRTMILDDAKECLAGAGRARDRLRRE